MPLHFDVPLTGGDVGTAHHARLRVSVGVADATPVSTLHGQGADLFDFTPPSSLMGFQLDHRSSRERFLYRLGGDLAFWDLPLRAGSSGYLRVPAGQPTSDPHVVDELARPLGLPQTGDLRVPVSYAPEGAPAEFRFDAAERLVRQEWPLAGEGHLAALRSLRVSMDRLDADPSFRGWTYQLLVPPGAGAVWEWWRAGDAEDLGETRWRWAFEGTGADGPRRRFWIDLPDGDFPLSALARDLGTARVMLLTDQRTGERTYHAFDGTELARVFSVEERSGFRLVEHADGRRLAYDEGGEPVTAEGLLAVAPRTDAAGPEGNLEFREVPVDLGGGVRAHLRVGLGGEKEAPDAQPSLELVRHTGEGLPVPVSAWRAERLRGDLVAVVPTAWDSLPESLRPPTRIVVDAGSGTSPW